MTHMYCAKAMDFCIKTLSFPNAKEYVDFFSPHLKMNENYFEVNDDNILQ